MPENQLWAVCETPPKHQGELITIANTMILPNHVKKLEAGDGFLLLRCFPVPSGGAVSAGLLPVTGSVPMTGILFSQPRPPAESLELDLGLREEEREFLGFRLEELLRFWEESSMLKINAGRFY